MKNNWYVAIDISKKWLDACIFVGEADVKDFPHVQVENSRQGINELMSWLRKQGLVLKQTSFLWEHTGGYGWLLREVIHRKGYKWRAEDPLEVKHRIGYSNDKNDRLDAARMADYLARYADRLKPGHMPSKNLQKLNSLRNERKFYVRQRAALKNRRQVDFAKEELRRHQSLINEYDDIIRRIEQKMLGILCEDAGLYKTYELLMSIPGIGFVNSVNFICITENNTTFKNARQYASYIGVAPHRKDSGKSVHWRARPSAKCDGQAKADLGQGAESAVEHCAELSSFFHRKIKGHEKDKDIRKRAYNAVKFKLVLRMFAVVNRGTKYYSKASGVSQPIQPTGQENYDGNLPCPFDLQSCPFRQQQQSLQLEIKNTGST